METARSSLVEDLTASLTAALSAARNDVDGEIKRSLRLRGELRSAAEAANGAAVKAGEAAKAAAASTLSETGALSPSLRRAVEAAAAIAIAPLHRLVVDTAAQVNAMAVTVAVAAKAQDSKPTPPPVIEVKKFDNFENFEKKVEERLALNEKKVEERLAALERFAVGAAVSLRADDARAVAAEARASTAERLAGDAIGNAAAAAVAADVVFLQTEFSLLRGRLVVVEEERSSLASATLVGGNSTANATAATENVSGRWIWKTRCFATIPSSCGLDVRFKAVIFDIAALNTSPSSLVWDASARRADVVCVRAGLYRVALGFFAATPPALVLLVDGLPVLTLLPPRAGPPPSLDDVDVGAIVTDAHAPYAPAGASITLHSHPAGTVAGVSLTHFVALPAGARVAVAYAGVAKGQGFFELAKL